MLTDVTVSEIRRMAQMGCEAREIAQSLGHDLGAIELILQGTSFSNEGQELKTPEEKSLKLAESPPKTQESATFQGIPDLPLARKVALRESALQVLEDIMLSGENESARVKASQEIINEVTGRNQARIDNLSKAKDFIEMGAAMQKIASAVAKAREDMSRKLKPVVYEV